MIRDFIFVSVNRNINWFVIICLITFVVIIFSFFSFFCKLNITKGVDFSNSTDNEDSIVLVAENFELLLNSIFSFFDFLIIFVLSIFGFSIKRFFLK